MEKNIYLCTVFTVEPILTKLIIHNIIYSIVMRTLKSASLILDDGTIFRGKSFGYEKSVSGEVVFNTAMSGYPESLTDPSYKGQLLAFTYPIIGNYGVPANETVDKLSVFYESEKIHVNAVIISDYSFEYSHWNARKTLAQWLQEEQIPGIFDIDTRALTKHLREHGAMAGKIVIEGCEDVEIADPNKKNLVAEVSCKDVIEYGASSKRVVLLDCGVRHNMVRCLVERNVSVIRVPWDYDYSNMVYDGLFISNGPGNPNFCQPTIEHIRQTIADNNKPILGIGMGNHLLAMASGAKTYKLKYGHRGHNQPVREVGTQRCYITTQNHGYAVDDATLNNDWTSLYVNLNDNSNEGIRHKSRPYFSAQFYPEFSDGPTDAEALFDDFIKLL